MCVRAGVYMHVCSAAAQRLCCWASLLGLPHIFFKGAVRPQECHKGNGEFGGKVACEGVCVCVSWGVDRVVGGLNEEKGKEWVWRVGIKVEGQRGEVLLDKVDMRVFGFGCRWHLDVRPPQWPRMPSFWSSLTVKIIKLFFNYLIEAPLQLCNYFLSFSSGPLILIILFLA